MINKQNYKSLISMNNDVKQYINTYENKSLIFHLLEQELYDIEEALNFRDVNKAHEKIDLLLCHKEKLPIELECKILYLKGNIEIELGNIEIVDGIVKYLKSTTEGKGYSSKLEENTKYRLNCIRNDICTSNKVITNINKKHRRNNKFEGRTQTLNEIRDNFTSSSTGINIQSIVGLGGIGKTQVAIEYAYKYIDKYKAIFWIDSDTQLILVNEYSNILENMGYKIDVLEEESLSEIFKNWLEENDDWLLVFDNVNNISDLHSCIPSIGNGHIIITSRNPRLYEISRVTELDVFTVEEATKFLLNRISHADSESAEILAKEMGRLALALEQSAAYINRKGKSITSYLSLFNQYKVRLFEETTINLSYNQTIATTWRISFESLKQENLVGLDALNILAFLHSTDIPLDLLRECLNTLSYKYGDLITDPIKFDEVVESLLKYSLISINSERISIHRLVQMAIIQHLSDEDIKYWIDVCFKVIKNKIVFDRNNKVERIQVSKYFLHAQEVIKNLKKFDIISDEVVEFYYNIGVYLFDNALHNEAEDCLNEVIKLSNDLDDNNFNIDIRIFLGEIYIIYKQYEKTIQYYNNLLNNFKNNITSEQNSRIFSNIGLSYLNLSEISKSLEFSMKAYNLYKQVDGKKGPEDIVIKFNLARAIEQSGNIDEAIKIYNDIMSNVNIDQIIGKQEYTAIISTYSCLLGKIGKYEEAKKLIEKALKIDFEICPENHPNIARDLNNYGYLLKDIGELRVAKEKVEDALKINQKHFGRKSIKVAVNLSNLGIISRKLGELDEAEKYYEEAIEINSIHFGGKHYNLANDYINLGMLYIISKKYTKAKSALKKAIKIDREIYGCEHYEFATDLRVIAQAILEEGKIEAAKRIVEKSLSINKKFNNNELNILQDYELLAILEMHKDNFIQAKNIIKKTLSIYKKIYGEKNTNFIDANLSYSKVCIECEDYEDALKYFIKCANYYENCCNIDYNNLCYCYYSICGILDKKNNTKLLSFYLRKAERLIFEDKYTEADQVKIAMSEFIGDTYLKNKENQKAMDFYKKSLKMAKQLYQSKDEIIVNIAKKIRNI